MNSIYKYQNILKKCGCASFSFVPIRVGHLVEFYEYDGMFLKASSHNINSNGFCHEYNMLKLVCEKKPDVVPEPIFYRECDGVQILCVRKILGEVLSSKNYNFKIAAKIKDALRKIFNMEIVHGDVKKDNIMIRKDGSVCMLDFELSSVVRGMVDFELSPDMVGNDGRNFTNLIRNIERE